MASRTRKIVVGCVLSLVVAGLIVGVIAIGFYFWLNSAGELIEPDRLLAEDTVAYAEWVLRTEDPGTEEFLDAVIASFQQLQRRQSRDAPPFVAFLSTLNNERQARQVRQMFPIVAAVSMRSGDEPGDWRPVFVISFERIGKRFVILDWMLGSFLWRNSVERYRGERIYIIEDEDSIAAFFLRGNDLFVTTDAQAARWAIDRIGAENPEPASRSEVGPLLSRMSGRPLQIAVTNGQGELADLAQWFGDGAMFDPALWEEASGLRAEGGFEGGDRFRLGLDLDGPGREWGSEQVAAFEQFVRGALPAGFDVELDARATEGGIHLEVVWVDLPGMMQRWVESQGGRSRRDGDSQSD